MENGWVAFYCLVLGAIFIGVGYPLWKRKVAGLQFMTAPIDSMDTVQKQWLAVGDGSSVFSYVMNLILCKGVISGLRAEKT